MGKQLTGPTVLGSIRKQGTCVGPRTATATNPIQSLLHVARQKLAHDPIEGLGILVVRRMSRARNRLQFCTRNQLGNLTNRLGRKERVLFPRDDEGRRRIGLELGRIDACTRQLPQESR
jgi:hypothetical protein